LGRTDRTALAQRNVGAGAVDRGTGLLVTPVRHVVKVVINLNSGGGYWCIRHNRGIIGVGSIGVIVIVIISVIVV